MTGTGRDNRPPASSILILGTAMFLFAFGFGYLIRMLTMAAGRRLGAHLIVWGAVAGLLFFVIRAMRRYRRIEQKQPSLELLREIEKAGGRSPEAAPAVTASEEAEEVSDASEEPEPGSPSSESPSSESPPPDPLPPAP